MAFINTAGAVASDSTASEIVKYECGSIKCRYNDGEGSCVFETCWINEQPGIVSETRKIHCMYCDKEEDIPFMEYIDDICEECREKLTDLAKLPFKCVFCDEEQDHDSKIWLSKICDDCFDKLKNIVT